MDASWVSVILLVPVCGFAGFVRGLSGFGGPMIAIPALQFAFTPKTSLFVALTADLIANIRLVPDAMRHIDGVELRPLLVGGVLGLPVGQLLLHVLDPELARRLISLVVGVSAVFLLAGWQCARSLGHRGLAATGMAGGISLGISGISLIVSILLQADQKSPQRSRANFVIWAFAGTAIAVAVLFAAELLAGQLRDAVAAFAAPAVVLVPAYVAGVAAGVSSYGLLDEPALRRWTLRLALGLAFFGLVGA